MKRIMVTSALCLSLLAGFVTATFAMNRQNTPDTTNSSISENVMNNIETSRISEYEKVGITLNEHGELVYEGELVRYLVEKTQISEEGEYSYQYLNENGVVDLIVTRIDVVKDGSVSNLGGTLEVIKSSNEEFTQRDIKQIKKIMDSTASQGSVDWIFGNDSNDNKEDGNFINKISDQKAVDWSFNQEPVDNKEDENYVNKIDTDSDVITVDHRIKEYKKLGLEVKYSETVRQDNPLKLMYADVFFNGKQIKEITDGDSFQVTFVNAPSSALSLKAIYDVNGNLSGFEEAK